MKNLNFLILLFAVAFLFSFTDGDKKNDLEKWHLKGKVKSVKSNLYISASFHLKYNHNPNDTLLLIVVKKYDINGNCIESIVNNPDGSIKERECFSFENNTKKEWIIYDSLSYFRIRWKYNYYDNGKLMEMISYKEDSSIMEIKTFQYNNLLKLIKEKLLDANRKIIYEILYKFNFDFTEKTVFNSYGEIESRHIYYYDKNGKIKEHYWFDSNNKLYQLERFTYYKNNLIKSLTERDGNNKIINKTKYFYNKDKNLAMLKRPTFLKEKSDIKTVFKYEDYDKYGNWLIKKEIDKTSNYISEIRKIEYYE